MFRETWTEFKRDSIIDDKTPIRFKGESSSKTERNIPNQTQTEAALQNDIYNYANTGINTAGNYLTRANNLLTSTVNPNWSTMANNYNNTMSGVSSGYSNLANGILPSSYATARQQALNADLTGTVGNAISNLGSRGILNSSVTNSALNNISQNASDTLAKNYSSDIGTYSNILNNQANNAANILASNASAQQNSYYAPSQYFTYANSLANPASNLFNTMYSGRMGTGSTTTTQSGGNSGVWQAVGGIGSSLITCFAAGTKIAAPGGDINVEDIKVGNKVYSRSDDGEIVIEEVINIMPPSVNDVYDVQTTDGNVPCTASQPFVTKEGSLCIEDIDENTDIITFNSTAKLISISQLPPDTVYDFTVSGSGVFFANNHLVEGWE